LFPFSRKILFRIIFRRSKENLNKNKTIDGEIIGKDKDEL